MATYSTVNICNKALLLCGASPITALSDDTVNARTLNTIYDITRKNILIEGRWTFALTRATVTANTVASLVAWEYPHEDYVYDRPTDALRVWETSDKYASWREEGDYIITNVSITGLLYTWDIEDESKFRQKFVDAFVDLLAYEISFQLLNSAPKAEQFLNKYQKLSLPNALAVDAQTGDQQTQIDDAWVNAKYYDGNREDPSKSYG
jgi:hypothetical protein